MPLIFEYLNRLSFQGGGRARLYYIKGIPPAGGLLFIHT